MPGSKFGSTRKIHSYLHGEHKYIHLNGKLTEKLAQKIQNFL